MSAVQRQQVSHKRIVMNDVAAHEDDFARNRGPGDHHGSLGVALCFDRDWEVERVMREPGYLGFEIGDLSQRG
jgi:hypothetical protein